MQTVKAMIAGRSSVASLAARAAAVAACALMVCGCNTDQQSRRHLRKLRPIIACGIRSRCTKPIARLSSSSASNRGELNPTQRAQVLAFGLGWKRAATGGVIVERPLGSSNERSAADAMREIVSILAASGLPQQSIAVHNLRSGDRAGPATVRISYPQIHAQAGPCGLWPEDIGPSFNRDYFENQPPWNFGCATQNASRRGCRRSVRPRPAARRDAGLHHAPHHGVGEIHRRSKYCDRGVELHQRRQDQRRRQIACTIHAIRNAGIG